MFGADKLLRESSKRDIGRWLNGIDIPPSVSKWPRTVNDLFDRVFGRKHLSWRCFFMSVAISIGSVVVMTILFFLLDHERFTHPPVYTNAVKTFVLLIGYGVIFNLIPDFLSLLETRYVLRWMSRVQSAGLVVLLMLVDLLATLAIFWGYFYMVGGKFGHIVFQGFGVVEVFPWVEFNQLVFYFGVYDNVNDFESFFAASLRLNDIFGVFLYSTFATSLWIWLYVLSGLLARLALGMAPYSSRVKNLSSS